MAATIVPPAIFIEHATRLRARKLEQIATDLRAQGRLHPAPAPGSGRRDLSSVLRQFRGRLR